jgi:hypothetical protein
MTQYLVYVDEASAQTRNQEIYESGLAPSVRDDPRRVTKYLFGLKYKGDESTEVAFIVTAGLESRLTNDEQAALKSQEDLEAAGWTFD